MVHQSCGLLWNRLEQWDALPQLAGLQRSMLRVGRARLQSHLAVSDDVDWHSQEGLGTEVHGTEITGDSADGTACRLGAAFGG